MGCGKSRRSTSRSIPCSGSCDWKGSILLPPLSDHPVVLNKLYEASIPIVRIAPKNQLSATPSIGIDDYAAARQITAHLAGLGHRRIGFILGRPEHGATEQRYLGFVDEMRAQQIAVDSHLVQTGNFAFRRRLDLRRADVAGGLAAHRHLCQQ